MFYNGLNGIHLLWRNEPIEKPTKALSKDPRFLKENDEKILISKINKIKTCKDKKEINYTKDNLNVLNTKSKDKVTNVGFFICFEETTVQKFNFFVYIDSPC